MFFKMFSFYCYFKDYSIEPSNGLSKICVTDAIFNYRRYYLHFSEVIKSDQDRHAPPLRIVLPIRWFILLQFYLPKGRNI